MNVDWKPGCFRVADHPPMMTETTECKIPIRVSSSWPQTVVPERPTCPEARVVLVKCQINLNSHG